MKIYCPQIQIRKKYPHINVSVKNETSNTTIYNTNYKQQKKKNEDATTFCTKAEDFELTKSIENPQKLHLKEQQQQSFFGFAPFFLFVLFFFILCFCNLLSSKL